MSSTTYDERIEQELNVYEHNEEVNDLPPMHVYWTAKYMREILDSAGLGGGSASLYADPIAEQCQRTPNEIVNVVSIGAGNCNIEAGVAASVVQKGFRNFSIECMEMNAAMRERGMQHADAKGVAEHIVMLNADFNTWTPDKSYGVVIASHSLHHVVDLEHLFDAVQASLSDDGVFVINDMIGRNGHMRWPEALSVLEGIWSAMPDKYKFNSIYKTIDRQYVNHDCSDVGFEGIRAQDILPMLLERFSFHQFAAFGCLTDPFTDRIYGPNLSPDNDEDRAFFDRVAQLDILLTDLGVIKPTHMVARLGKSPVENAQFYKHWTPEFCVRRVERKIMPSVSSFSEARISCLSVALLSDDAATETVERLKRTLPELELDIHVSSTWDEAVANAQHDYTLLVTEDIEVNDAAIGILLKAVRDASPGIVGLPFVQFQNGAVDIANGRESTTRVCALARTRDLQDNKQMSALMVQTALVVGV